ncbi:hypothetical protein LCGC14_1625770 [marine sediment metagenome]|uniref:Uncharacterized protein n=1 Tax=marine sediment metagenome TaxID=412755 RepID=A0A0F9I452_9ZZZZ
MQLDLKGRVKNIPERIVCSDTQDGFVKNVSIFELKRPFTDRDDPIKQLYKYINLIRKIKSLKINQ